MDLKITQLNEMTAPATGDLLAIVNDPGGSPETQKIKLEKIFSLLNPPSGFLINGKIVPSVTSNNLTVAIKGMDGNDPSATNPVYVRIGDTVRSITAALSVTKNAATNWCNAGSAGLATKEVDYFVYLGYNATDGVVIGFSRIGYATEYDDFSATTTNEKYAAISTIANAAAGDDYVNIGRFAATLSAGAGYTWTVPTYTNKNLIQRPIYETRTLLFVPGFTGFSTNPTISVATYKLIGNILTILFLQQTLGTSNANTFTLTQLPFACLSSQIFIAFAGAADNSANLTSPIRIDLATSILTMFSTINNNNTWTTSGTKGVYSVASSYPI